MPCTVKRHLVVGAGDHFSGSITRGEALHRVVGAGDQQRRHSDGGSRWIGQDLPVPVEVAVPVQPSGEPSTSEFADEIIELSGVEPVRCLSGCREARLAVVIMPTSQPGIRTDTPRRRTVRGVHVRRSDLSVQQAVEAWLAGQRLRPKTRSAYITALRPLVDALGGKLVQLVTKSDIETVIRSLVEGTEAQGQEGSRCLGGDQYQPHAGAAAVGVAGLGGSGSGQP